MGLYTSYNVSDYYDNTPPKPKVVQKEKIVANVPKIDEKKRKSLYEAAQEVAEIRKHAIKDADDFKNKYRVGQKVAIQGGNGEIKTKNGTIAEIVASNLMYVYMEDSYIDVTGQYLTCFVTEHDKVFLL